MIVVPLRFVMDDRKTLPKSSLFQYQSSLSHFLSILSRYRRLFMNSCLKVFFLLAFLLSSVQARAQMFPWGMGAYGAQQSCPGGMGIPSEAKDALNDVKQRQKELDELNK